MAALGEDEFAGLDAVAQAGLVRKGEVAPGELVEAAIGRLERVNPALNAVVTPMYDEARAVAAGPLPDGPLAGVPFLLKDLVAEYAGVRFTEGSAFLADHRSERDSELVARHRRAGLITIGKTNTPEFGLVPTTEPRLFGPTRNPWDTSRTPGGSSGGSAAAVAAGVVPIAHGNDGGGSIRIPASCCGLFGLKPTRGRNSLGPDHGEAACGLAAEHAVSRTVRDSAALLDATAGPAPGDPYWPSPPERPYLDEVGRGPGRLRIAFSKTPLSGIDVHPDCIAAVEDAARLCADLGHEVEEAAPAVDGLVMARRFAAAWLGFLGWAILDWRRRTGREPEPGHFEPWTWRMYEVAQRQTSADYLLAVQDLHALARQMAGFFETYDVWLTPTLARPPVPLGYFDWTPETAKEAMARLGHYTHFTLPCNVTGQPAMSVPLYWTEAGLPIGSHFIGRYGDEATLFRLAGQLEAARPWTARRPPVTA